MEESIELTFVMLAFLPAVIGPALATVAWWLRTNQSASPMVVATLCGVAGLLFCGSPQVANGSPAKGAFLLLLSLVLWFVLMGWVVLLYSAYDGAVTAYRLTEASTPAA